MNFLTATLVIIWTFSGLGYVILADDVTAFQKLMIAGGIIALSIVVDMHGFISRLRATIVPFDKKGDK